MGWKSKTVILVSLRDFGLFLNPKSLCSRVGFLLPVVNREPKGSLEFCSPSSSARKVGLDRLLPPTHFDRFLMGRASPDLETHHWCP